MKEMRFSEEASILLPGAGTKRPDRIILRDGKTIIVDFKFGEENPQLPLADKPLQTPPYRDGLYRYRVIYMVC